VSMATKFYTLAPRNLRWLLDVHTWSSCSSDSWWCCLVQPLTTSVPSPHPPSQALTTSVGPSPLYPRKLIPPGCYRLRIPNVSFFFLQGWGLQAHLASWRIMVPLFVCNCWHQQLYQQLGCHWHSICFN
jgi:hypothetical protein